MKSLLFSFLLLLTMALHAQQPGTLDASFGVKGILTTPPGNDPVGQGALVVTKQSKIISGNRGAYGGFFSAFRISALMPDGTPDLSFGKGGSTYVVFPLQKKAQDYSFISSLALQPDGKILASGELYIGLDDSYVAFARFLPDGTVDSSFGSNGTATATFGYDMESAGSLTLQPDGKFLIGGRVFTDADQNIFKFYTARFLPDGEKDETYGNGGIVLSKNRGVANGIALQKDGKIVAAGYAGISSSDRIFYLERYNSDGSYDKSFNGTGIVSTTIGNSTNPLNNSAYINSLTIQDDGKITVAGTSNGVINTRLTIARYNVDGSLDKTFGEGGINSTTFSQFSEGKKILIGGEKKDKLIVAGSTTTDGNNYLLTVISYHLNGSLYTEFGNQGIEITGIGGSDVPYNAAIQPDGKILVTGYSYLEDNYNLFYTRYYGYPQKVSLIVRIKRWLQNHTLSWKGLPAEDKIAYYTVEQSADGTSGFTPVAKVSGAANLKNYSLTNSRLLDGTNYYRIKAVSTDGVIRYSEVVSADNTSNTASVFPNPAKNYVTVQGLSNNETANISIKDGSGNVLSRGVSSGSGQYRSPLGSNMQPGTYYLNITTGSKTEVLKFVKE